MNKKDSKKKVELTRPVVEEKRKEKKKRVEKGEEEDISSNEEEEEMEYEDAFDDEQESEEEVIVNEDEEDGEGNLGMDVDEMEGEGEEKKEEEKKVFRPGIDKLEEGQELVYDSSAYYMYHALRPSWPCLSFDIFHDSLGENRTKFPHTVYVVAGTQAEDKKKNSIICMKMTDLHKTKYDEDSENESESDEGVDDDPILVVKEIPHHGSVNRLRCVPQSSHIVATWSETGKVHIWNIQNEMSFLDTPPQRPLEKNHPIFTFSGHTTEGFALDWSPAMEGRLLSGDCNRNIHLWEPFQSTNNQPEWRVANQSFIGHKSSVEDIQWSPIEPNVFASCSVDKTIKIWDTRKRESFALSVVAHDSDVNVISWNRATNFLLASGSDDGSLRIWDLRNFSSKNVDPAADFKWHTKSITSVQWHPTDGSMLAASGADDQISIWDLSLEREDDVQDVEGVPPQLLFVHQGQTDIKEVQWHKQIPGALVSTAATGFNVFKPENT